MGNQSYQPYKNPNDKFDKLSFTSFLGGVDTTTETGSVGVPSNRELEDYGFENNTLRKINGASIGLNGSLVHPGAKSQLFQTTEEVLDFVRVLKPFGGAFFNIYYYLVKISSGGSSGDLQFRSYDDSSTTDTLISQWTPFSTYGPGWTNYDYHVITAGDFILVIGDWVQIFNPRTNSFSRAGYVAASGSVTGVNFTDPGDMSGNLFRSAVGSVTNEYQWIIQETDGDGFWNNPGPLSSAFYYAAQGVNAKLRIDNVSTFLDSPSLGGYSGVADGTPGPGLIHVYRVGGDNAVFRKTGSFQPTRLAANTTLPDGTAALAGEIIDTATGNYYADTTRDDDLPDLFLSYSNQPLPNNVRVARYHANRLYMSGYGSGLPVTTPNTVMDNDCVSPVYLWFTRPNNLSSVGYDDDGVDDDGGFIILDGDKDDDILQFESIGPIFIIGRKKSVYALYGSGFQSSRFDKRSNIGIASRRAMCRCGNSIRMVCSDGFIRELGDTENPIMSDKIYASFRAIDDDTFANCVTYYHQSIFYVSFPNIDGTSVLCFAYDERLQTWTELSQAINRVNVGKSVGWSRVAANSHGSKTALIVARCNDEATRGLWRASINDYTAGDVISNLVDPDVTFEIETDLRQFSNTESIGRFIAFNLQGDLTDNGNTINVDLTCGSITRTYPLQSTAGKLMYYVRLPADLIGKSMKARIYGTWQSGEIRKIEMGYDMRKSGY